MIVHVSNREAMEEIARAQRRGLKVYGETCPQYLAFTSRDLDRPGFEGAKYVCSPALRSAADQDALWLALRRGTISVVSSDHSPFSHEGDAGKKIHGADAPFSRIPNGLPGIELRLPFLFSEGVMKGRIDLNTFVAVTATNPAKLFGLYPRKGSIGVGMDADIAIWDPSKQVTITHDLLHDDCDYTPYEGIEVTGWPVMTFLRGKKVMENGEILGAPGDGAFLRRELSPYAAPTDKPAQ